MTERWRVLVPRHVDPSAPERIAAFAECTPIDEYADVEAARADVGRYDAILLRGELTIDAELLARAGRLQVVAKHGTGLDNVDVDAATDAGVLVCNTPGANSRSVAEHALLLLLAVRRGLRAADAHVREGGWDRGTHAGREVRGDALGVVGFGEIGSRVADLARGFGLPVLAYDPYLDDDAFPGHVERLSELSALFERADAVTLHTPLTDETRHLVSTAELEALGPDGVLLNTARGPVVDEAALVDALDAGTIAGAGLDVYAAEPPVDSPLLDRDDVILTPHVAGVTRESLRRVAERAAGNVRTVYEGGVPHSTVNPEAIE